ncbi:MAG: hypothetical protein PVH40_06405, partial [Gemmatimonadales bacterium]
MRRKSRSVLTGVAFTTMLLVSPTPTLSQVDVPAWDEPPTELTDAMRRFVADRGSITRFFDIPTSAARRTRMTEFYGEWLDHLDRYDFEGLSHEGKVDWLLFRNHVEHELEQLGIAERRVAEAAPLLPFGARIVGLEEARRRMEWAEPFAAASQVEALREEIEQKQERLEAALKDEETGEALPKRTIAWRAVRIVNDYRRRLESWFEFYHGYDPMFSWWVENPYTKADEALEAYADFLRDELVGIAEDDREAMIGDPIGRDALLVELQYEMIPYTPEQLLVIAEREYAWCLEEMEQA